MLSQLLFVISLILLTHILRTDNPGYESPTGETVNHLLFMDDHKLYSKIEKALDSLIKIAKTLEYKLGLRNVCDKKVENIQTR